MTEDRLTLLDSTDALLYFVQYCKDLMTENIAMSHTLKDRQGWMADYRSYQKAATISTEAAFQEIAEAVAAQKGLRHALAHFASLYPVKPLSD